MADSIVISAEVAAAMTDGDRKVLETIIARSQALALKNGEPCPVCESSATWRDARQSLRCAECGEGR